MRKFCWCSLLCLVGALSRWGQETLGPTKIGMQSGSNSLTCSKQEIPKCADNQYTKGSLEDLTTPQLMLRCPPTCKQNLDQGLIAAFLPRSKPPYWDATLRRKLRSGCHRPDFNLMQSISIMLKFLLADEEDAAT
ncbi:hypothetical protein B0H17DRAFT_1147004 [Mycena rosella]|uniref:Uncharacterized protein n=1 Tax=Mycena rosella TaxID=1033263 RepID=A0AAD7CMN2_MYCRO|nr:hypothetical protein B0H17DRAFT_1147004 [Mycena rosella]